MKWQKTVIFNPFCFSMESTCGSTGSKVRLAIGTEVHIFNFNSSTSERNNLKCHLELSVPSSLFGFVVFIEEMFTPAFCSWVSD